MDIERVDDIIQRKLQNPEFKFYWDRLAENPNADVDELEREYHRLYDKSSPEIIDTSSMVTDTLIQALKDIPNSAILDFEKENKKVKKIKNNLWKVDGKKFNMPGLLKFLNIDNTQKVEEDIKMDKNNKILRDRIRSQIEKLEKNDLLVYDVAAGFGFNKLYVKINNLHPKYYSIWNEDDEGEIANLIKYSDIENIIDWVIRDATSFTPKLYRNKYIKMEEDWHEDSDKNYIDRYIWIADTSDSIEKNEFLASLKENLEEMSYNYKHIQLGIEPYSQNFKTFRIIPIFDEIDFGDYTEIPSYELLEHRFKEDYDFENLSALDKDYVKNYVEELLEDIININKDLKQLESWGLKKVEDADNFRPSYLYNESYSYKDKRGNDKVDLEYNGLHYEADYGLMDWETGTGTKYIDTDIDYTYTIDKQDIEEFFADFLSGKDPVYDQIEDYDEYYKYIDDNFDDLMDKYYDDVLNYFAKDAEEEARETLNPEDYEYYPDYDDRDD